MSAPALDPLVEAELEILRQLGVGVYRTHSLDGEDPILSLRHMVLLIGTDLTPEEAESVSCDVLGMIAEQLAG